jgi:hypothetical protein
MTSYLVEAIRKFQILKQAALMESKAVKAKQAKSTKAAEDAAKTAAGASLRTAALEGLKRKVHTLDYCMRLVSQ